ncbi:hypothetical protein IKG33_02520 [Candidatus Saccharibacteria bacterium]|nr:hypothetical protein [Candidatus Saccharibacteria bacterium]
MPDDNNITLPTVVSDQPVSDPVASDSTSTSAPTSASDLASVSDPISVPEPTEPEIPSEKEDKSLPSVPTPSDLPDTPASDVDVAPAIPTATADPEIYAEVASKIGEAHNVLIALSSDPSVDEMAAAIGFSLFLDRLGKRATAIYSGSTPNALEFLKPEETFESTADTLQDFVIALNKEKADHLRYKLDGDYVKIYITPYRTRISEEDLEFSYGDFNVDLVVALDVTNGIDLDSALREHGRIMHSAVIINVTTGNPGKFGEIEWSDKSASSVSEMIARLLYSINSKVAIEKEEATAFLTGIVAATNRFSNAKTTPETMKIASRLMESGANQQLISKNITPDIDNEMYSLLSPVAEKRDDDPTKLDIEHGNEEGIDETKEVDATVTEKDSTLLDDLKAAEASLAAAGAETTPDTSNQPIRIEDEPALESTSETTPEITPISTPELSAEPTPEPAQEASESGLETPASDSESPESTLEPTSGLTPELSSEPASEPSTAMPAEDGFAKPEKVIQPQEDFNTTVVADDGSDKYGKMLEEALANSNGTPAFSENPTFGNPALANAPAVSSAPEINGVPEMNYMPLPDEEILPPPPAPPIDMNGASGPAAPDFSNVTPIEPAMPVVEPTPEPLGPQPAMQDQVYQPQASDPGAFKIPGM